MVIRAILPDWADDGTRRKVLEGEFSEERIKAINDEGYNVYWLPNYPGQYDSSKVVDGSHIDTFCLVFVDMDLKQGKHTKDSFIEALFADSKLEPTFIVDSGNGIHAYWEVSDLDAASFLRFQRRLCRKFDTDEAVSKIYQLMRAPGTKNTKDKQNPKPCSCLYAGDTVYTCEQLDGLLPPITQADEAYCVQHYGRTYKTEAAVSVDTSLPPKFSKLMKDSAEAQEIWGGSSADRSGADWRLGHIMLAHGFTRDEAMSVLVNAPKALSRAPAHRISYAEGVVDKIWTNSPPGAVEAPALSESVRDILHRTADGTLQGTRFECHKWIDATDTGFRLGQIIGLVAGVGVGKTAMALNMFMGFVQNNPDYVHFFIPLEQPANEIADRWRIMCGENTHLHDMVHIMSNYDNVGGYRHLSLDEIKDYLLEFQKKNNVKIGCVVIDHIGVLKKKTANGENQGLIEICQSMKAFAVQTNTLLVMQSQSPREKAGIGDLELDKDAAYGTVFFEAFVDYLVTIWQPLKRCYDNEACPTVTAYKFCKIRHKKVHLDEITEDTPYCLYFDPITLHMRKLTQAQETSFKHFATQALAKRKSDKKTDLVQYKSISWVKEEPANAGSSKVVER